MNEMMAYLLLLEESGESGGGNVNMVDVYVGNESVSSTVSVYNLFTDAEGTPITGPGYTVEGKVPSGVMLFFVTNSQNGENVEIESANAAALPIAQGVWGEGSVIFISSEITEPTEFIVQQRSE